MPTRSRRPRRHRPPLRARLVEAPVSSMNTSFLGSRSSCAPNHSWRRFKTSGRCCSSACAVFFECDLLPIVEAPDHRQRETLAAVGDQPLLDFQQRDVRLTTNETKQIFAMRLNAVRAPIPARRSRGNLAGGLEAPYPTDGASDADPETLGRRVARQADDDNSVHHTFAKIVGSL